MELTLAPTLPMFSVIFDPQVTQLCDYPHSLGHMTSRCFPNWPQTSVYWYIVFMSFDPAYTTPVAEIGR